MQSVRSTLVRTLCEGASSYQAVLISGSGTAAMELGLAGLVPDNGKVLVIRNGVYGDRLSKIADVHGIAHEDLSFAWGEHPSLPAIETRLQQDASISVVAVVHHETTTGLINPVSEIGALCQRYEKLFFVDSVSGLGAESFDFKANAVDVVACTANKCLHGLPGVSFVLLSDKARAQVARNTPRALYFDLQNYIEQQEKGTVPFTPCVPATLALNQALKEFESAGGLETRIALYRKRSTYLRQRFTEFGLKLFLEPELRSNSITTIHLPAGLTYEVLHRKLKQQGFVIYAGQGKLSEHIFRVANLGEVPWEVYENLAQAIGEIVAHTR